MPLSADNFVHENNGSTSSASTSIVVSLAGSDSTTAGNTVVVFLSVGSGVSLSATGFAQDASTGGGSLAAFHKSEVSAAETSWTFTASTATLAGWYVVEMSNLDPVDPFDATVGSGVRGSTSNGGTLSTGTSPLNAGLSSVAFAVFSAIKTGSGDTQSWSGYTNSFEEVADIGGAAVASGHGVAVARKFQDGSTTTFQTTGTFATSAASASTCALIAAYRSADSSVVAPLAGIWGFEWGTHGGYTANASGGLSGFSIGASGTWGTAYLIQSGSARTSGYGLRIVNSATSGAVACGNLQTTSAVFAFNVRVVSATGTVVVGLASNAGASLYVLYDASASKFGVRWGTGGTPSWQSGTTATNTWTYIQVRMKTNTTTYHCDWRLETGNGTSDETSPADTSTGGSNVTAQLQLGSTTSQTMTADYDDVITSRYYSVWPIGVHVIKLLTVDPSGTPSVSGTSSNFNVFTANGTLGAWNAANARDAVDEVPPTISASADGVVQNAVAASDYMEFPMATYTCAYNEVIAAVRMYAPEWGGTGTGTGTLGIRGHDGTTETTLVAASTSYDADSLTTLSSTVPRWDCAMWPSPNGWTQAELNAAVLRVGFSTDATPDMGVHAIYLEVAIKTVDAVRQLTEGEDEATADIIVHPYTSSTVSYVITNNSAEKTYEFGYSLAGTPQTPVTVTANSSQTLQLNADAFGDVSDTYLTPL